LLKTVFERHVDDFQWKSPPYEYEFEKLPFDLITGDPAVRKAIESHESMETLAQTWKEDLARFERIRRSYFLYT
jgi:uncharacterized protein YbbC (DUF1343 family)